MSLPQPWNLGHHSQWLATVGVLTPSSFISQLDKLWHMIYIPELPMGSEWGWDVLDFFLFLSWSFPSLLLSPEDTCLINHFHLNPWLWVGFWENLTSTGGQMSELVTATDEIYVTGMEGAGIHHSRPGSKVRVWIIIASWSEGNLGRNGKTRVFSGQCEWFLWKVIETDDRWLCVSSRSTFFP